MARQASRPAQATRWPGGGFGTNSWQGHVTGLRGRTFGSDTLGILAFSSGVELSSFRLSGIELREGL